MNKAMECKERVKILNEIRKTVAEIKERTGKDLSQMRFTKKED